MSGTNIQYVIEEKLETSEGSLTNIYQKNSRGFRVEGLDTFTFFLKLKTKAIISLIDYKPMVGQTVLFELLGDRKVVQESISSDIEQNKANLIEFKESRERKSVTTRVRVELINKKAPILGVGLIYILLKGEKVEDKSKSVAKIKDDYFDQAKYSVHKHPVSVRKKEVFDNRSKTRNEAKIKSQIENLEKSYNDQINNDSQLKKAIALSEK